MQLTPAIHHRRRETLCLQDGEHYDIINPATVAPALRANNPPEGYACQSSMAQGETMLRHRMTYRICADGTVLCDFDRHLTQDVHLSCYLGCMHQEPCDAFGGG